MITSYSTLQAAIADELHRSDLTGVIPTWIALAEARFNRKLRVRQQETSFASVALVNGAASLPADFLEFKALWVDGTSKNLSVATSEFVRSRTADSVGRPLYYAVEGSQVVCWPENGDIEGIYYAKIPALSDSNTSNWLLTAAPDLYLYEVLAHSAPYLKNDARVMLWKGASDQIMGEIVSASKASQLGGGPLSVRVR